MYIATRRARLEARGAGFLVPNKSEQLELNWKKSLGFRNMQEKLENISIHLAFITFTKNLFSFFKINCSLKKNCQNFTIKRPFKGTLKEFIAYLFPFSNSNLFLF